MVGKQSGVILKMVIYNNSGDNKVLVVSGFPGIGKTTSVDMLKKEGYRVVDSDYSLWAKERFPRNYITHLSGLIRSGEYDVIFVSSHYVVREELIKRGIKFTLVYPDRSLKDAYIQRYIDGNSPTVLIDMVDVQWGAWMDQLDAFEHELVNKLRLIKSDIHLYNLVQGILENTKNK